MNSSSDAIGREPPPSGGIAAVAASIQDRAQQLAREQETLEAIREKVAFSRGLLEEEARRTTKVRQEYLESSKRLHSVELEYIRIQEQMSNYQQQMAKLLEERARMEGQLNQEQVAWQSVLVEGLLAHHQTKQGLYLKTLQGAIDLCEEAKTERERKIQLLKDQTETFQSDRDWILQQQQQVEVDMVRIRMQEEDENKQVETLADRVRYALQEVGFI
jgi:uncharacterized protein YnzC (UPF0291/DUF896 family)